MSAVFRPGADGMRQAYGNEAEKPEALWRGIRRAGGGAGWRDLQKGGRPAGGAGARVQLATSFFSPANGLSPSHRCMLTCSPSSPVSFIVPVPAASATVVRPIQIEVIVRRSVAT